MRQCNNCEKEKSKLPFKPNQKDKPHHLERKKKDRPHRVYEASNDSEQRLSKNKQPFGF